jgi:hypothetical protein
MVKRKEKVNAGHEIAHMGTHSDMILKDDISVNLDMGGKEKEHFTIVAEDGNGRYFTQKHYVAGGLLDPNRDPVRRRSKTSLSEEDVKWIFPDEEPTQE